MNTMATLPNPGNWSNLPLDILRSLLESLSFVDFQRAKMVCSNWYFCSKLTTPLRSPWMMLFLDDDGCVMYNPDEDRVYKTKRDFSGTRILANSGNWFLMLDSRSNLYILDMFSENRTNLPPLDSVRSSTRIMKRMGDREFLDKQVSTGSSNTITSDILRGLLWVDERTRDYVVVWFTDLPGHCCVSFCKKGDTHYMDIPLRYGVPRLLNGLSDLLLRGYRLYISTTRCFVRVIDLSGKQGFVDITGSNPSSMFPPHHYPNNSSIAVTTEGEVLLVESTIFNGYRSFHLYKKDPNTERSEYYPDPELVEVHSLGDEALLLDLGITVSAKHTLGIKPNCIYFTSHFRAIQPMHRDLDICVFDLSTKVLKHFAGLDDMNLKDARWFIPGI